MANKFSWTSFQIQVCAYCADQILAGSGIILENCQHIFCRTCLQDTIRSSQTILIDCPVGSANCKGFLLKKEIKSIATEDEFEQYLERCFKTSEKGMSHLFNCKGAAGYTGMWQVDGNTSQIFLCPNCEKQNCLSCNEIHEKVTCELFHRHLSTGYSVTQIPEVIRNESMTGWDQLYSYVNESNSGVSCSDGIQSRKIQKDSNTCTYNSIRQKIEGSQFVPSTIKFGCSICFETIWPGEGIVLQECLHPFCRRCIVNYISHAEDPTVKCPFIDRDSICSALIAPREIKALLPRNLYEEYLNRSIKIAELVTKNSYHCVTPNCVGWCEAEKTARFFWCPICGRENCIRCKAFHEQSTCEQYKKMIKDDKNKKIQQENERVGESSVLTSIQNREFQRCPKCKAVCLKISGCNNVICAACKAAFIWRH